MHDVLTHAERVVLETIRDTPGDWVDQETIILATGFQKRAVAYALHELERGDFVDRLWSGRRRTWKIAPLGRALIDESRAA